MENLETIKADLQKSIDEAGVALKTKASNAEDLAQKAFDKAEAVLKSLDGVLSKEDAQKMQSQLDKLDIAIQKSAVQKQVSEESFKDAFLKAYAPVQKEIERMKSAGERLKAPITFEIQEKTVGTISLASTLANVASSSQVTISEFTGVVSPIRQRLLTYLSNVSVGAIGTQYAVWVEEYDQEGTPVFIGEGVEKTQLDVQYKEQRAKVNKIGVHMKVTTEMLEDAGYLFSYIQSNGVKRVETVIENQLFNGSGTDPQLIGLIGKATAFTGASMAGKVEAATNWDVIHGIIAQVKAANGQVNGVFVETGQYHVMLSEKDGDKQYILPAGVTFDAQGGLNAWGVRIIPTNALTGTSADFVGGDLSVVNVRLRTGIQVAIGEAGDDFIDNLKTVRIEQRLVQFISANDVSVLVKGTFSASKAILETT
jgi:HK97 family phage major capsid protein